MKDEESIIGSMFKLADVEFDGSRPWDIKVHDRRLYKRVLAEGVLGFGESYMDGWWDCDRLDELMIRLLNADLEHRISPLSLLVPVVKAKIFNLQRKAKAAQDVGSHYDQGNVLFQNMLDARLTYSCGYWKDADNLDEAQEAKLDLVCRKIGLKPGQSLLDIGCGWGSLLKFAAERYQVRSVGVTLSSEQVKLGRELCQNLTVEIRLQDYRELDEKFDHVVSIGMIEHVGAKNYKTFMNVANRCLDDDGLFLLHTVGASVRKNATNPWTNKYIFPGGMLPTAERIATASEGVFVMEDWHSFGVDYSKTLTAWYDNFNDNWGNEISRFYDPRFYRMWKYFLLTASGAFRARRNQLWQIVFSKKGLSNGYLSVR